MGRDSDNGHDDRSMTKGEWKTQESKDGDIKATYTEGKAAATAGEGYTIAEAEDGGRAVAVSGDREKISKEMADGGKHRYVYPRICDSRDWLVMRPFAESVIDSIKSSGESEKGGD